MRDAGIDPIDRKVDEDLGQDPVNGRAGKIARRQIALRDLIKCAHDAPELRREASLQNLAASQLLLAAEIAEPAADALPQIGQRPFSGRVMLQGAHLVHEIVAGGPIRFPALRKLFAIGEDFFDNEIGGPGGAVLGRSRSSACRRARSLLQ